MHKLGLKLILPLTLGLPTLCWAGPFDNSLWLGTDATTTLPVLNTDRSGTELRRVAATEATGIAIDPARSRLYFGIPDGTITARDLANPSVPVATITPATSFAEDLAFDGTFLWQADLGAGLVKQIRPSDGEVMFSFDPGFTPMGVAWDGSRLWVSQYTGFTGGERIQQFTPDGQPTGQQFTFTATLDGSQAAAAGGLAFDSTDQTLWVGSFGQVFHVSTAGTVLESFRAPVDDNRFIDGLEFQGAAVSATGLVSSGVAVPGGSGVFTTFPQSPTFAAGHTAFLGQGSAGSFGLYFMPQDPVLPQDPIRPLADLNTAIPGGTGTFTGFTALAAADTFVSFIGTGTGQMGLYATPTEPIQPGEPVRPLADLGTAIPNGTGTFTGFTDLAAADSFISFIGTGAGQAGIYAAPTEPIQPSEPLRPLADLSTAIPGGTGTFTGFSDLAAADSFISFIGTGTGQIGIYAIPTDPITPSEPIRLLADLGTVIPGSTGTFTGFTDLAAADSFISFIGTGTGQIGIYAMPSDPITPSDPIRPIADLGTAIPGGTGSFTGFTSLSASGQHTAFLGLGNGGQAGIYLASTLSKVIAVGDQLAGKTVTGLRLGPDGLDGITLAFTAAFADGTESVFKAQVATYEYTGFLAPVDNLPVLNQVNAGKSVPVKFSLHGNQGLAILAAGYPQSLPIACEAGVPVDSIEETVSAGGGSLTYDPATNQYSYIWKTQKAWANTCRQFQLQLNDGSLHKANFRFR